MGVPPKKFYVFQTVCPSLPHFLLHFHCFQRGGAKNPAANSGRVRDPPLQAYQGGCAVLVFHPGVTKILFEISTIFLDNGPHLVYYISKEYLLYFLGKKVLPMTVEIIFWIAALLFFAVVEAATVTLASIWFCGGAVAALIAAALGASLLVQIILFLIVSALLLACLRPMAKKIMTPKRERTNADRILGRQAIVTEAIDPLKGTGAVRVGGIEWTATCATPVAVGEVVQVRRIEGVKVIVIPETAAVSSSTPI
jgi:membrane protein implicated in regulation of membrane protease activity